ncbi:MAG: LLM class flavin-dependent oxidoreductase [Acidimicrobiia bacterium]|nr:LLM class flavin-dependent oxidoreductase [Acidimicrobiia bacterium]
METGAVHYGLNRWDWRTPSAFAVEVARAEEAGFSHAFLPVNPLAVPDPYVFLAAGAAATERMVFGPLLETPVLRPPAVAAGSIATIDAIAPGRAMLTYGVGDTAVRWLGRRPATVAELEAACRDARRYLAGDAIDVGAAAPARLRHARPVPVWLAAGGPRTLRMAGRVADGVFIRVGTHPANLRVAVDAVRAGAVEAGRSLDDVDVAVIVHTASTEDPAEIRALARAMAAGFYEYSPALFDQAGFEWNGPDIEELKTQIWPDFHHAADLVAAGRLVDFLPDDVARSFSFCGSTGEIAEQLTAVLDAVPEASIVVPHPIPTPRFGHALDHVTWFSEGVIAKL